MLSNNAPEGYKLLREIDLQKDPKLAKMMILGSIVLFALVFLVRLVICFSSSVYVFEMDFLKCLILLGGMIIYIIMHELTHALVMKIFEPKGKINFGVTFKVAYAGMRKGYFKQKQYIATALAPLIIWTIVFALLTIFLPAEYFLVMTILQGLNVSGAIGDIYVSFLSLKFKNKILVNDDGMSMRFYILVENE